MRLYNDTERANVVFTDADNSNTATITIVADPEEFWNIDFIGWSVDQKPSNTVLTVEDTTANAVLFRQEMKADDKFGEVILFGRGLQCEMNSAIEITLTGDKMHKDLTVQYS
jgi:hypothetical protein